MGAGMWFSAFRGFYNPDSDLGKLDPVSKWLFASRSVIWIISAQAAMIAGLLAFTAGKFNAVYFVLVLIGFVAAHATSNLVNDYFGYARGHDSKDSPRLRYTLHPLANSIVTKRELRNAILVLVSIGLLIAAYFTIARGYMVLIFLAIGVFFLAGYDVFPVTLKSVGLGEISTFVVWGPLMVGSGYYLIAGTMSAGPFLAGVPYGLGVMSILVGKHMDQIRFDRSIGQRTLPILLGDANARRLNIAIISLMYISIVALVVYGMVTLFALAVFLNMPNAVSALKVMSRPKPRKPPKGYVGWPLWYHRASLRQNKNFGWLYILGLLLGGALQLLAH